MNDDLPPKTTAELNELRARIDEIDRMIVRLVAERQRWIHQAAQITRVMPNDGMAERIEQVIANVRTSARSSHADPDVVERLYRSMISAFIDLERNH